jgi:hypothetical protein
VSSLFSLRMKESGEVNSIFAESFWLAKKEIKRSSLSYVLTGLFVLFSGLVAALSLSGVLEPEGLRSMQGQTMEAYYFDAFLSDSIFLLVCAFLGVNTIYRHFTQDWRETFSSRLLFLRSLPISTGSLVSSRAVCMLFILVLNALAFFVPAFFLLDLGELGATTSYLWFACVWIGYGLLGSGVWLLLEFSVSRKVYILFSYAFFASVIVVVAILDWTHDLRLVGRVAQLAHSGYGALAAIFSILAGGAALLLLSRITTRRLQKWDLSA